MIDYFCFFYTVDVKINYWNIAMLTSFAKLPCFNNEISWYLELHLIQQSPII